MWRTALKPRWLGLLAVVLLVLVSFGWLGAWQLAVARDQGRLETLRAAPQRPVAPVEQVLAPHAEFPGDGTGRRVTATGRYDGSGQVLVAGRRLAGRAGFWVVAPLVVDSTAARLAVVRGFVADPGSAPGPPQGPVQVAGALAPGESPAEPAGPLGPGQLASLDLAVLVNRWPGQIYNAFVFATAEQPPAPGGTALQPVPPPPPASGGLAWRNAAYALQWWVFAGFAAYMWWRMVRDDAAQSGAGRARRAEASEVSVGV